MRGSERAEEWKRATHQKFSTDDVCGMGRPPLRGPAAAVPAPSAAAAPSAATAAGSSPLADRPEVDVLADEVRELWPCRPPERGGEDDDDERSEAAPACAVTAPSSWAKGWRC